jgi:tetratricopeptide (TPR) repeat protein
VSPFASSLAVLLVVCAPCATIDSRAWADTPATQPSARDDAIKRHNDAAFAAFEKGRYVEAIEQFTRAYTLNRDHRILYNIGLSHLKRYESERAPELEDLRQARSLFKRFLQLVSPASYPDDRSRILKVRQLAKSYLESVERKLAISISTKPSPASRPATGRPAIPRPPEEPGDIDALGDIEDEPRDPDQIVPVDPGTADGDRRGKRKITHWFLYGAAAALALTGAVTGLLALDAASEAEDRAAEFDGLGNEAAVARADRLALTTDILLGAAAGAAVAAVAVQIWSWVSPGTGADAEPRHRSRIQAVPSGLMLELSF